MPVYQVVTSGIQLTDEQRTILAKRFTEVHHQVTKAPEPFIRIVFEPMPLGLIYTAGEVAPSFILHAGCRAGRSDATRNKLLRQLYAVVDEVTALPPDQIIIAISETPSSWLMEAGLVMPEPIPEAEAAWIEEVQKRFPGKYDSWK